MVLIKNPNRHNLPKIKNPYLGLKDEDKEKKLILSKLFPKEQHDPAKKAEQKASEIIAKANNQAQYIIANAQQEAKRIKEEAQKAGYQAGMKRAEIDTAEFIKTFRNLLEAPKIIEETIQNDVLPIAIAIAERVIKAKIATDDQVIIRNLDDLQAFFIEKSRVVNLAKLIVQVNPAEVKKVNDYLQKLLSNSEKMVHLSVKGNKTISKGGCLIETNFRQIDATIKTQMEAIINALRDKLITPHQKEKIR